jgi:tRNA A-37 threonylcarbamoyl transferase component Bud32
MQPSVAKWLKQRIDSSHSWSGKCNSARRYSEQIPVTVEALNKALTESEMLLKDDQTTTVARYPLADETLVIKRYNPRSQWHKIKRALRRTRADRCWQMSYLFAQAGLYVARPLLMFEHRLGPIRFNAYFVNQLLEGEELLSALPKMTASEQQLVKRAMIASFQKMSLAMITHGDLKASNIIWKDDKLYFIDLDAAQVHRNKSTWAMANNKDRKRFLKNWRDKPELLALFEDL